MSLCAVWAAFGLCTPLNQGTLDFDAPGLSLERTVSLLGERLNERLDAAPPLQDEVMVVHVRGVQPQDLLDRIARVTHAEWQTTREGRLLARPKAEQERLKAESLKKRADEVRAVLEKAAEPLGREFTAADAQSLRDALVDAARRDERGTFPGFDTTNAHGPLGRLTFRLLLSIGPEALADIEFGERKVFTFKPTKLQSSLGPGAAEALEKYTAEQNVWAAVAAGTSYTVMFASDPFANIATVQGVETGFRIVARRAGFEGPVACNLLLPRPDRPDNVLFQAYAQSKAGEFASFASRLKTEWPEGTSDSVRRILSQVFFGLDAASEPLTEDDRALLESPTKFDVPGAIAEAALAPRFAGRDLVADLSDKGAMYAYYLMAYRKDEATFDKWLPTALGAVRTDEGEWTLIEPADPYAATWERTPRLSIERLIVAAKPTGRLSFEQIATFNASLNAPSQVDALYLVPLRIHGWQGMGGAAAWHASRLYGSLSRGQREALQEGKGVTYGQLSSLQKQRFAALALSDTISSTERITPNMGRYAGQYADPTDVLVQGFPSNLPFTLAVKSEQRPFAYLWADGQVRAMYATTAQAIASSEKIKSDPELSAKYGPTPVGYAPGTVVTYAFRITYDEKLWQAFYLDEDVPDDDAQPGDWKSLPPEMVEQIKKEIGG